MYGEGGVFVYFKGARKVSICLGEVGYGKFMFSIIGGGLWKALIGSLVMQLVMEQSIDVGCDHSQHHK